MRTLLIAAALFATPSFAQTGAAEILNDAGYRSLFNGTDLSGWVRVNCAPETFTVVDRMIKCTGVPTGVLRTEKQYTNFEMDVEWRHMKPRANAGIFIWSDPLPVRGQPFTRSVEVQVMIGMEGDGYTSDGDVFPIHGATLTPRTGKFAGQAGRYALPTGKFMKPSPEWNKYHVKCVDGEVTLSVNGHEVTKGDKGSPATGYICLESEGSEVHFRNLMIKELPGAAATAVEPNPVNAVCVAGKGEGFVPLYNGLNLDGWKVGPAQEGHWKADNWTISFDGQPSDELWTTKSYKDFVMVCDWRWTGKAETHQLPVVLPSGEYKMTADGKQETVATPEAGDSGIYLRGSSKSQVNMWCWPVGSGEVYGYRTDGKMPAEVKAAVTPKVNADAPIGEWNRFVITMKGELLTVELNGKVVIEQARLPGVAAEGPIALQQHGSAVQFANIYIKELKAE